jgi:DNA ligase-1
MAKQEFVQLAHTFKPEKHNAAGAFLSEKLDGERAVWDGGVSRGVPASDVPWSNTVKDARLKVSPVSTGLWSRTGKVIHAPEWFCDALPAFPIDGELWAGRKNWQQLSSIVSQHVPDERWHLVTFMVFDTMTWQEFLKFRVIKVRNEYEFHVATNALEWALNRAKGGCCAPHWTFEFRLKFLEKKLSGNAVCQLHQQEELPFNPTLANERIEEFSKEVVEHGAEGVVIRKRTGKWISERSWDLLKYKPWDDAEGTVTGYYSGKKTDKGSKLLGLMGALEVEWQGAKFKISGFKDSERQFASDADRKWAVCNPGERCPSWVKNPQFPVGSEVTFKYRELSDDCVPKEARYHRIKVDL